MQHTLASAALLVIGALALLGAWDYITESVRIFLAALKRYRERNRD